MTYCLHCGQPAKSRFMSQDQMFCERHWSMLPGKAKRRFWDETEYGAREPSRELVNEMQGIIETEAEKRR